MATNVWCLLIDECHEPNFGEPFPVSIRHDDTIHELKVKIQMMWNRHKLSHVPPNHLEIWKCESLELSARDSFDLTKKKLDDLKFYDDYNDDTDVTVNVQHLGVAQRMSEFSNLRDDEIWLVVVPQNDVLAEARLYSRPDRPHKLVYPSAYERYWTTVLHQTQTSHLFRVLSYMSPLTKLVYCNNERKETQFNKPLRSPWMRMGTRDHKGPSRVWAELIMAWRTSCKRSGNDGASWVVEFFLRSNWERKTETGELAWDITRRWRA
ncbi:hypothetical protein EDB87DRAFT_1577039 [Lactarius vividus]|nr:hypothetical protein EDB87DRAFT_1577039 [Lactarius vividus]